MEGTSGDGGKPGRSGSVCLCVTASHSTSPSGPSEPSFGSSTSFSRNRCCHGHGSTSAASATVVSTPASGTKIPSIVSAKAWAVESVPPRSRTPPLSHWTCHPWAMPLLAPFKRDCQPSAIGLHRVTSNRSSPNSPIPPQHCMIRLTLSFQRRQALSPLLSQLRPRCQRWPYPGVATSAAPRRTLRLRTALHQAARACEAQLQRFAMKLLTRLETSVHDAALVHRCCLGTRSRETKSHPRTLLESN